MLCGFIGGYFDHISSSEDAAKMRCSLRDAKAQIDARDWSGLMIWISATCERYFSLLFGRRLFSVRAALLAFGYAFLIALLGIPRLERDAYITLRTQERLAVILAVAIPCSLVDICVLAWARLQLRRLAAGVGKARLILFRIVAASYAGVGVAVLASQLAGATLLPALLPGVASGLPAAPQLYVLIAAPLTWPYIVTSSDFGGDPFGLYLYLPAALSGLTVSFSILTAMLIARSPRFIGRPIAAGLDNLASSPKGIFATLGGAIGLLGSALHDLSR